MSASWPSFNFDMKKSCFEYPPVKNDADYLILILFEEAFPIARSCFLMNTLLVLFLLGATRTEETRISCLHKRNLHLLWTGWISQMRYWSLVFSIFEVEDGHYLGILQYIKQSLTASSRFLSLSIESEWSKCSLQTLRKRREAVVILLSCTRIHC